MVTRTPKTGERAEQQAARARRACRSNCQRFGSSRRRDLREFAELVQDAHIYDWIVFTSANGVEAFFEIFFKLYDDAREIGGARIATIGPATAQRVKDFHLHVDLQPEEFVAEAVVQEFQKQGGVENLRILLVRAEKARDRASQSNFRRWERLWTRRSLIGRCRKRVTPPAHAGN